jgi:hypothetical protein
VLRAACCVLRADYCTVAIVMLPLWRSPQT